MRLWRLMAIGIGIAAWSAVGLAQEKSVKPGINDPFRKPDVQEFVGRFEVESREVFTRRKEILEACQVKPGQVVADIGAGTGLFTRAFAEAVGREGRVLAVDIAQPFLDHIETTSREAGRKNVETVLCKPDSIELPAASVDLAFICDTYHHFEFPQKTMASVRQALKPDGRVVLIDFRRVEGASSEWVLNHVRAGQEVFEAEILQAGFRRVGEPLDVLKENYFVTFVKSVGPPLVFPIIPHYGGVAVRQNAVDPPRRGAKVVVDATPGSKAAEVSPALVRVARLLNLYGAAEMKAEDVTISLVLHGDATKIVLHDEAYSQHFGTERNPNLPLLRGLQQAGVEVSVCGQALTNKGYADDELADDIPIAASALTAIINKQQDGYSYVPIP